MAQTQFATTARNDQLASTGLTPDLAGGKVVLYAGTQPANADTAITSQTVLGTLTLPNPAAGAPSAGVLTLNLPSPVAAVASGVANFARVYKADGTTVLFDTNVCNQTVTLNAVVTLNATSITVLALAQPLYAGQDLWFNDGGTLKKVSVTANATQGATSVTISAAAAAISNSLASTAGLTINNPNVQINAILSISSATVTIPAQGS